VEQRLGTAARPARIAIIGAGPAGFYAAEALLRQPNLACTIDFFNRFPTPFGLVREGVAPDHQSIKAVTRIYDRIADDRRVRYFGNVTFGTGIRHEDLNLGIHTAIVCLLINNQAFGTSFDNWRVVLGIHRADLNGDRRKIGRERAHALGEITAAHKLRMLAGNKKDLAKSLPREMLRFGHNFIDGKRDTQDWIIPRETAILTIVDAFVGKIERCKEPHGPPKILQCERARSLRHCFEFLIGFWRNQILKALDQVRFPQSKAV
jgi:hypothetical protein